MKTIIGLFLALLMFTAPAEAAAEYVIIAADGTGAAYAPGSQLSAGQTIKLPDGARVTLLSKAGTVVKLKGPYSGSLPANSAGGVGSDTLSDIASLVTRTVNRSRTLGATRSATGQRRPDTHWHANIARTRNVCAKLNSATLWRKRAKTPAAIAIAGPGVTPTSLIWKAGNHSLALPSAALRSNAEVTIITGGRALKLKLHIAPSSIDFENKTELLAWMANHNCADQAAQLIRRLHTG